ncbi:DUF6886 family protein [Nitrobacter sp. NHB1]|uniref:DUF6886 family protein n=1 Tax=Nitrobacter sp. NHB1 TaxID=3119830 RepID=UPI003FA57E58
MLARRIGWAVTALRPTSNVSGLLISRPSQYIATICHRKLRGFTRCRHVVSRAAVKPLRCDALFDLPSTFAPRSVDLHVVDSLLLLKPLWKTTLYESGIRLRNAKGWA